MGEDNLAKVFGPTLVGYSCPEPQLMQTVTETRTQQAVVKLLFSVPDQIYSAILSKPPSNSCSEVEQDENYFSPSSARWDEEVCPKETPTNLGRISGRVAGLGMSRKRFLPRLLSSDRTVTDA
ncbi:Rac GTPase-activating protein 1 [Fasciolopsis buskii]|uniref:Rac GTPase-activating protein 1 n=1 Tax=Fasciolopsis buskii TaxID=27845 RepID=A0A8E0VHR3_9TREM|nr:Rac GTPase-activating protein 1 [Fasciolopsis buski]